MDVQGYRFPLHRELFKDCANATADTLRTDPVQPGRLLVITHIAILNNTNNFSSVRVSIGGFGRDHILMEDRACVAGYVYWTNCDIAIPQGKTLQVTFYGATLGDDLFVYITGYEVIQPAPGAPNKPEGEA